MGTAGEEKKYKKNEEYSSRLGALRQMSHLTFYTPFTSLCKGGPRVKKGKHRSKQRVPASARCRSGFGTPFATYMI